MSSLSPPGPVEPAATPAAPNLGALATRGLAWMTGYTVFAKIIALAASIILAWLLLKHDFAMVALVMAAASLPSIIQHIGIREALIQKQSQFGQWANGAFWLSCCVGVVTALAIAAAAPLAAIFYGEPTLAPLMMILAAAAPFISISTVPLAKLQLEMRHRAVAGIGATAALAQPLLTIALAWLDWGPYAIVVPQAVTGVARAALFWAAARFAPAARLDARLWPAMLRSGGQLLLARALWMIMAQADYLLLGYFYRDQDDVVGIYFFAFNLSMQTIVLLLPNMDSVLLPALTSLQGEPQRQRASFLLAARALAFFAFPVCFLQAALADPGVHAIIDPKWFPAIPVIQALSIGMAFRTAAWAIHSLIPAQGRFGTYTLIHAVGVAAFLPCVLAGALLGKHYLGGALAVAIAVSVYFAVEAPILMYVAMRPLNGRWSEVLAVFVKPIALAAISVGAAAAVGAAIPQSPLQHWLRLAVISLVAVGLFVPLGRWWMPDLWQALRLRLGITFKRRRADAL